MLAINKEFRKGILFVRLIGILNVETVKYLEEDITSLVIDMQIRNVVFNISGLSIIDITGINEILKIHNICKHNNGISLLCGVNDNLKEDINNSLIHKNMMEISDEISAIKVINI